MEYDKNVCIFRIASTHHVQCRSNEVVVSMVFRTGITFVSSSKTVWLRSRIVIGLGKMHITLFRPHASILVFYILIRVIMRYSRRYESAAGIPTTKRFLTHAACDTQCVCVAHELHEHLAAEKYKQCRDGAVLNQGSHGNEKKWCYRENRKNKNNRIYFFFGKNARLLNL